MSLKKASGTVKETSETADKILKDVVTATKSMAASSGECLNTFEAFINKEGKITQDNLSAHFQLLDAHLASQSTGVTSITDTSNQVSRGMASPLLYIIDLIANYCALPYSTLSPKSLSCLCLVRRSCSSYSRNNRRDTQEDPVPAPRDSRKDPRSRSYPP